MKMREIGPENGPSIPTPYLGVSIEWRMVSAPGIAIDETRDRGFFVPGINP